MKRIAIACVASVFAGCVGLIGGGDAVTGLRVNHLVSPANISEAPVFSWKMESGRQGARQTAYQLEVREDSPAGARVWQTGTVESGASVGVAYAGAQLKSAHRYFWKVSIRDEKGKWLDPAEGFFETGLFGSGAWEGSQWISAVDSVVRKDPSEHGVGKQEAEDGTSCFVKKVPNGKTVAEAFWTVTGNLKHTLSIALL